LGETEDRDLEETEGQIHIRDAHHGISALHFPDPYKNNVYKLYKEDNYNKEFKKKEVPPRFSPL